MMMSEQPIFGKKPALPPAAVDGDAIDGPNLRHDFAEEYEGFEDNEGSGVKEPLAPVEGLWGESDSTAPALPVMPPEIPADIWTNQDPAFSAHYPSAPATQEELPAEATGDFPWGAEPSIEVTPPLGPKLSLPPEPEISLIPEAGEEAENEEESEKAAAAADIPATERDDAEPLGVQDELLAIAAQHQRWLESGGKEGRRAALRGDRFRHADFSGLFLPEASFRGADLRGVRFRAANLSRVDFAEADLTSTDFSQALLDGANFQRAQISHANFSAVSAQEADFSHAEGVGANFSGARLEWAILREAQLSEADFRRTNLTKANLRGAALFRAQAEHANLTQADCRDANLEHAKLSEAILLQTHFRMANLGGVNMQAADFSQALEVPAEAAAQSAQQEREWLMQEAQRLDILRAELLAKERELGEGNALRRSRAHTLSAAEASDFQAMLKSHGRVFTKMGAGWLIMVLAVLTLVLNVLGEVEMIQLSFLEILILGAMLLGPLALCLAGVIKSMNLSRRVLDFITERDS